jgi:glycosyltransferase involved in cell wall biosynthesis
VIVAPFSTVADLADGDDVQGAIQLAITDPPAVRSSDLAAGGLNGRGTGVKAKRVLVRKRATLPTLPMILAASSGPMLKTLVRLVPDSLSAARMRRSSLQTNRPKQRTFNKIIIVKLLRCIYSLDPALGGPQEAVRQACLGLSKLGHTMEVVCLDEPEASWLHNYPAKVYALGPAELVFRKVSMEPYGYSGRFVRWMRTNAANYDAVIVDGLWGFHGLGTWLALRGSTVPYFVIPHSQLDPWFKYEYPIKHAKKWLYWLLVEYRILRDARAVLYYNEQERVLARRSFWLYRAKEAFAGSPVDVPLDGSYHQRQLFFARFPELRNKRLILFLGRIGPKKGCDLLIEAFAQVCRADSSLHLVCAGPDQVGWQQELQRRVVELGLESRVTWTGMLAGDAKWGAFHSAEVFVLPSHTEGWPIAVIEAMACGLPVLISNKVNIWPEVQASGGGFVANDDLAGTIELLERWLQLTPQEHESMKRRARKGFIEQFASSVVLEQFISVLRAHGVQDSSKVEEGSL